MDKRSRKEKRQKGKGKKKKDTAKSESTTLATNFIRRGGQGTENIKNLRVLAKIKLSNEQGKGLGEIVKIISSDFNTRDGGASELSHADSRVTGEGLGWVYTIINYITNEIVEIMRSEE